MYVYKVLDMFLAGFMEPSQVVDHSLGAYCLVHVQFTKWGPRVWIWRLPVPSGSYINRTGLTDGGPGNGLSGQTCEDDRKV